jgi:DNA-directed RNA polymerase subunit K/omega
MVNRPVDMNAFEFVVISALRARQLLAGSVSRRDGGHNASTTAQMEVAGRCVVRSENEAATPRQCLWQI